MDNQDKEFETLLRQFELRRTPPFLSEVPVAQHQPRRAWWMIAAAAAFAVVLAVVLVRVFLPAGPKTTVEFAGASSYKAGDTIDLGNLIRSGAFDGMTISLRDGTRIEMRAQSGLSIEAADDGQRVRLESGGILVTAAKQAIGHLYVETHDTQISVTGVFLVESEPAGTRVSVVEGEVEVHNGASTKKLLQGEQFFSDPGMKSRSLAEAIAWSRRAAELTPLLPPPPQEPPVVAFTPAPAPKRLVRKETIPAASEQPSPQLQPMPAPEPAPAPIKKENPLIEDYRRARLEYESTVTRYPRGSRIPDIEIMKSRMEAIKAQIPLAEFEAAMGPQTSPSDDPKKQPPDSGNEGPGKAVLDRACGLCHPVGFVSSQHFDNREAYANLVSRQIAYGAPVSSSDAQVLIDYLFKTYRRGKN